jgi:hypothetical protein
MCRLHVKIDVVAVPCAQHQPMMCRPRTLLEDVAARRLAQEFEIRKTKSETNSKLEKEKRKLETSVWSQVFRISSFEFVSNFEMRVSSFLGGPL